MQPPTKRCELPLFFAAIGQGLRRRKALDLGSLNMQFLQDWPKCKKITALSIFWPKKKNFAQRSIIVRL